MENPNIFDIDLRDFYNDSDTGNVPIEAMYQAFKARLNSETEGSKEDALLINSLAEHIQSNAECLDRLMMVIYRALPSTQLEIEGLNAEWKRINAEINSDLVAAKKIDEQSNDRA